MTQKISSTSCGMNSRPAAKPFRRKENANVRAEEQQKGRKRESEGEKD